MFTRMIPAALMGLILSSAAPPAHPRQRCLGHTCPAMASKRRKFKGWQRELRRKQGRSAAR